MTLVNYNTPEAILLGKERVNSLSREALLILYLILESPNEVTRVTINEIKGILREMGWKWITIRTAIKEVREFVYVDNRSDRPYRMSFEQERRSNDYPILILREGVLETG